MLIDQFFFFFSRLLRTWQEPIWSACQFDNPVTFLPFKLISFHLLPLSLFIMNDQFDPSLGSFQTPPIFSSHVWNYSRGSAHSIGPALHWIMHSPGPLSGRTPGRDKSSLGGRTWVLCNIAGLTYINTAKDYCDKSTWPLVFLMMSTTL